jgi:hypothetical protein
VAFIKLKLLATATGLCMSPFSVGTSRELNVLHQTPQPNSPTVLAQCRACVDMDLRVHIVTWTQTIQDTQLLLQIAFGLMCVLGLCEPLPIPLTVCKVRCERDDCRDHVHAAAQKSHPVRQVGNVFAHVGGLGLISSPQNGDNR